MKTFANQRAFDNPGTRLRAAGQGGQGGPNSPIYAFDGSIAAYTTNGGIEDPMRYEIPRGTRLLRFGQGGVASLVVQGEWWLAYNEFRKVLAFADQNKMGLGAAVRMLCAVPSDWSQLDLVVHVKTHGDLLAYAGPGNVAVLPPPPGRPATAGTTNTGLVDRFGKLIGAVHDNRPAKLAGLKTEYIPMVPDTSGQRITQLFIPGLGNGDVMHDAVSFLGSNFLPPEQSRLGYAPIMI